jgi:hypothetical protein
VNYNESNFKNGLPVEIKASTNKQATAIFLFLIAGMFITSAVCIWRLTLNFNIDDIIIAFLVTANAVGFLSLLPSSHYTITFNLENFSYNRFFLKGTVSYTDIKAVYRIKRCTRYGGDYYHLKVKLNSGRTLKFSLGSLFKPEMDLMQKLFKVRAGKGYIDKKSIF